MNGLNDIRYFLSVAKTLNVSRAAELSGVSQPALSHALKRLEEDLGAQLLLRSKTGVRLTKAGQKFAVQSRELLEKWDSLAESVHKSNVTVSGEFKIGCHTSVAIYTVPAFLKGLQEKYPELQIQLRHGLSREVTSDVLDWKLDFGLVINPVRHPDLVIRELAKDEVTLWSSTKNTAPDTLIMDPDLFQTKNILRQLEQKKMTFKRHLESSSLEVIRALTVAGCGVGLLPSRVAQGLQSRDLKRVASAPVYEDTLCLIYRAGTQNHASGRAILDAIQGARI